MAVNGSYYRGEMGSDVLDQPLRFAVADQRGDHMADQWIHFTLLEGDGAMSADSIKTGSDGKADLEYTFSGASGHAVIKATVRNLDSVGVYLRANTLIFGDHGQGQYVHLDDSYGDVVAFNGPPPSLDTFPALGLAVANYESTLGVVVVIYDTDENGIIEPSSPVYAVFVVDSVYPIPPDSITKSVRYEGTTVEGIGIGSHWLDDVRPVYGFPNFLVRNDEDTALLAWEVIWNDLHLKLWCHQSDSTAFQIDVAEEFDNSLYDSPPRAAEFESYLQEIRRKLGRRE